MKYVIHRSPYMYDVKGPTMHMQEADSVKDLIVSMMVGNTIDTDIAEEHRSELNQYSEEDLVKLFEEGNGDGQSYVTVFSVDEDKQILG